MFYSSQYLRLQSSFTRDTRLVSLCVWLRRVREQLLRNFSRKRCSKAHRKEERLLTNCHKKEMDERHHNILTRHRPYLLKNLEPIKLLPHLSSILDESDRQKVKQEPTTEQQIDKLLDIISSKGPDAFGEFIKALEKKQMFIVLYLRQDTEMEKIKTELTNARAHSARMREKAVITRQELEKERETHKRTLKELEALKKLEKEKNAAKNMEPRLQELEDECYSHCEKLKEELNLIKTEKENLEKEVGKLKNSVKEMSEDYQRAFQTTLQKERESHSRCEELQRTLNVITGERDSMREQKQNLDKEVLNLNNIIKEIREDYQRTKKELQQILKEERENVSRELVAANEQRKEEKNVLQGKNEELKDQIKRQTSEVQTKTVQPTREKRYIEKNQKEGQPRQMWALNHNKEKRGVVYAFATDFGKRTWESGSSTRIIATRSSDHKGFAKDLLEKGRGAVSGTKDEEDSWWCVELPAKYVLNLTHYTLSRSRNDQESYILNWRLEGSLDGHCWKILKEHERDNALKANPYSHTWSVDGERGAFRYFRVYQTGKNSSGKYNIFLSGIELYGVLIEMGS